MSLNVGIKSADRGKKPSPSKKNSPNKSAISVKTETSRRGNNSSVPTIDRYLIKRPAPGVLTRTNNNNVPESKKKTSANKELEPKTKDVDGGLENVLEKQKESSPELELIIVDDSAPEADLTNAAEWDGSKLEKVSVSDSGGKSENQSVGVEKELPSGTSNGQEKEQLLKTHSKKSKLLVGDGDITDDVESETEAETQEYDLESTQDAQRYVDYKEEDFNTDSDFDKSDLDSDIKEPEDGLEGKEEKCASASGSKRRKAAMGGFFSKNKKAEKCQGSSSEEEWDRPWRQRRSPSRERARPYPTRAQLPPLKRRWSDRDTEQYRNRYPGKKDDRTLNRNALFYQGKERSRPDGVFIDDFHKLWWSDHDRLERQHGYIQWLFPIRESGMNHQAQELQLHEAETIRNDKVAMERFKKSYEMMLYFYGIRLVNKETGEVTRADNWEPRFKHLNHSMHNYLRITRILKCLGEMGLEGFKAPFLEFMLNEATNTGKLDRTLDSCYNYWIGTVRDPNERKRLLKRAEEKYRQMNSKY